MVLLALPVVGLERALHAWPPEERSLSARRRGVVAPASAGVRRRVYGRCRRHSQRGRVAPRDRCYAPSTRDRRCYGPPRHRTGLDERRFPDRTSAPAGPPGGRPGADPRRSPHLWKCLWTMRIGRAPPPDRAADDLAERVWEQAAQRLRTQLAEATWHAWFQGRGPSASRTTSSCSPSRARRRRAHPLQLRRACSTPRSSDTTGRASTSSCSSTPSRRRGRVDLDRGAAGPGRRGRRPRRGERVALGVGHPQPALHVRPVRHRRVQPLRARGRALGRRGAGPGLQPALHLRAGGAGQDPPAPRDRPPRAERSSRRSGCATSRPSRS